MTDRSRPHQFPTSALGEEVVGWECQACGEWVRERGPHEPSGCSVDWRRTKGHAMTRLNLAAITVALRAVERHHARVTRRDNDRHQRSTR